MLFVFKALDGLLHFAHLLIVFQKGHCLSAVVTAMLLILALIQLTDFSLDQLSLFATFIRRLVH